MQRRTSGGEGRERDVAAAFVAVATSLAKGHDVVELLHELAGDCARLLDVAAAGLLLADGQGALHLMAASSESTRKLELFQLQQDQGPCRDCFHAGRPVLAPDLDRELDRWPQFVPAARMAGFASVHALPMRLQDNVLGALGLFGAQPGRLNRGDLVLAQALADIASVALVHDRSLAERAVVIQQLEIALSSRVVLEQAKGMLAQRASVDMSVAFASLRGYARDHNLRLGVVASALVSRSLPVQQVLDHARVSGRKPS